MKNKIDYYTPSNKQSEDATTKLFFFRGFFIASITLFFAPLVFAGLNTPTLSGSMDSGTEIGEYQVTQDGGNCAKRVYVAVKEGGCTLRITEDKNGGCSGNDARKKFFVQMNSSNIQACQLRYTTDHNNGLASKPSADSTKIKVNQYVEITGLPVGVDQPIAGDAAKILTFNYTAQTKSGQNTKALSGNNQSSFSVSPADVCTVVNAANRQISIQSNSPRACYITLSLGGNADVTSATKTVVVGMAALQRVQHYQISQDNNGDSIPLNTIFTTETPSVCAVGEQTGKLFTQSPGNCIIRAYTDYANNPGFYKEIIWPIVADIDHDGIPDIRDNCPNIDNPNQEPSPTTQGQNGSYTSSLGIACNTDFDNDGKINDHDNCPLHYNPNQEIDLTTDAGKAGFGMACAGDYNPAADQDGDSIANQYDNCAFVKNGPSTEHFIQVDSSYAFFAGQARFNSNGSVNQSGGMHIQKDSDQDGVGDACDSDWDGDGVPNVSDNCPYIANADQLDSIGNGVGDACRQTFVKQSGNNTNDCNSWAFACATLERGIASAKAQGLSQVFIGEGNYSASNTINLEPGVDLFAGFTEGDLQASKAGSKETVFTIGSTKALFAAENQGKALADEIVLSGFTFKNKISTAVAAPALLVKNSRVLLRAGHFVGNTTTRTDTSAAIVADNAMLSIMGTQFSDNSSANGGAIYSKANSQIVLNNASFTNNKATNQGAAIYQANGEISISNSTFDGNTTKDGVIAAVAGNVTINKTTFKNNTATGSAAAAYITASAKAVITASEFTGNTATASAGALFLQGSGQHSIKNSIFELNKANHGGAMYFNNSATTVLDNNIFLANTAQANGGAIYMPAAVSGMLQARHNTFVNNQAANGGAIYSESAGSLLLQANLIAGNTASTGANLTINTTPANSTGYNLIGSNSNAGISGVTPTNSTTPTQPLEQIVANQLTKKGGDGYNSPLPTLPIVGGGPARNLVPATECSLTVDMRGEQRPDNLSSKNGEPACDAGAYEFTALSCEEDAARRYAQGELFIKSCAAGLEDFELSLGYSHAAFLLLLSLLFGVRLYRKVEHR